MNAGLGGECADFGAEAGQNQQELRLKEDIWRTAKRTRLTKALMSMCNRSLALGLGRWKDI